MTFNKIKKALFLKINTVSGTAGLIFTSLIATSIFFIALFIYLFGKASEDYEQVISRAIPAEKLCGQLEVYLAKSVGALDNYLLTGDVGFKAKREAIWNGHIPAAVNKLLFYTQQWENKNAVSYVYEIDIKASRIRAEEDLIEKTYPAVLNMTFDKVDARKSEINKLDILTEDLLLLLDRLIQVKDDEISLAREAYLSLLDKLMILSILCSFVLIVIGILATLKFRAFLLERVDLLVKNLKEIAQGTKSGELEEVHDEFADMHHTVNKLATEIHLLNKFLREASEGNFNLNFEGFEQYGRVGEAADALQQKLRNFAKETETHNWLTEGISYFAEILREKSDDVQERSQEVLVELVKYLDASQGAVYLQKEAKSGPYLELSAKYAYESLRYQEGRLSIGEGMLGEAFKERRQVYLETIPKNYLQISTGLGESEPRALLIMPLMANGQANGIIEIASFHRFEDYQIEFVKRVCESMSSTILHTESAQKTKFLLQEANANAEMMQTQEEEMRQNMEELLATQEELSRQKLENEAYMKALKQNLTFEFDVNGNMMDVSYSLAELLHVSPSEMIGKPLNLVFEGTNIETIQQQLTLKKLYVQHIDYRTSNDNEIPLKINFIPVIEKDGTMRSVLAFCVDISEEVENLEKAVSMQSTIKEEKEELAQKLEERIEKILKRSQHNEDLLLEKIRRLEDR